MRMAKQIEIESRVHSDSRSDRRTYHIEACPVGTGFLFYIYIT